MPKRKPTILAVNQEGTDLYVKSKYSGIHPMVVLIDGMSITRFGKGKTCYLKVLDVIRWHTRELRITQGRGGDTKALRFFKDAYRRFRAGQLQET